MARGSLRLARRASADASRGADKAAFRAEWGDYKPARASGTRDDDGEAPTLQKENYYRSLFVRSSIGTNLKRAVG